MDPRGERLSPDAGPSASHRDIRLRITRTKGVDGKGTCRSSSLVINRKEKVKEADLYSTFIEVPYTQGAQVGITQCYLQTTPYLPLPRKHSPDGASQTEVEDVQLQPTTHLSTPKG